VSLVNIPFKYTMGHPNSPNYYTSDYDYQIVGKSAKKKFGKQDTIVKPQAVFTYQNRSILIKLKSRYLKELQAVIDKGVKNYGLEDESYWNLIRQTSIKYWLEWDRNKIFDLTIL